MPVPPATPPPVSEDQRLLDQFELGDSEFDPDLDLDPADMPAPEKPTAPRGPDGKFQKAAPTFTHSKALVRLATDFGLSADEIAETPAEDLRTFVQVEGNNRATSRRGVAQPTDPTPTVTPVAVDRPADAELPTLTQGQYDDDLVNVVNALVKEVTELRTFKRDTAGKVETFERFREQQANEANYTRLDKCFSRHPELFGDGPARQQKPDSDFGLRIQAVIDRLRTMQGGTLEENHAKVVKALFGADTRTPKQRIEEEMTDGETEPPAPVERDRRRIVPGATTINGHTREEWMAAGLRRPSHVTPPAEPKGDKRATRAVAEKMRSQGLSLDGYTGGEEDGLPE